MPWIEIISKKSIRKIEVTTTQAVDVEQLARDMRASIGDENILGYAMSNNLHKVRPRFSRLEVIVHITVIPVRETTGEATGETGETEEPPPKRARCDLDA